MKKSEGEAKPKPGTALDCSAGVPPGCGGRPARALRCGLLWSLHSSELDVFAPVPGSGDRRRRVDLWRLISLTRSH